MFHSHSVTLEKNLARPRLSANPEDRPGSVHRGSLQIRYKCTQVTPLLGDYLPELHLRRPELRQKYKEALERLMNLEVFGYFVEVEVI